VSQESCKLHAARFKPFVRPGSCRQLKSNAREEREVQTPSEIFSSMGSESALLALIETSEADGKTPGGLNSIHIATFDFSKLLKMKNSVTLLLLLAVLITTNSSAQDKPLPAKILNQLEMAEKAMVKALSNGDPVAFKQIAGDDYVDIDFNGVKKDLRSMLNDLPNFQGLSVSFSEQSQRVYQNFVLRTGRAKLSVSGKLIAEVFYTQGWLYRDKRWQLVHWQGTTTHDFSEKK
jgi:hypothetical protein